MVHPGARWVRSRAAADGRAMGFLGCRCRRHHSISRTSVTFPETAAAAHLAHGRLLVNESEYASAIEHLEKAYKLKPHESLAEYLEAVRELGH